MEREIAAYLGSAAGVELRWGLLPERMRAVVGSEAEWLRAVRVHSISVQSAWSPPRARSRRPPPCNCAAANRVAFVSRHHAVGDQDTYLSDMLTSSRERGLLYPYHLAEAIAAASKSARLDTPFEARRRPRTPAQLRLAHTATRLA
jgi:hypothetical protein